MVEQVLNYITFLISIAMSHYYNQNINSHQKQNQNLVMDQNYSNNILGSCLSSLQSLANTYLGDPSQLYKNKMFNGYDIFDYSAKTRLELKNQVVTNLMILKASLQLYKNSYPNQKWTFPANLSYNQFMSIVNQMMNIFSQYNDQQAWNLSNDLINLICGNSSNSYYEKNTFSIPVSDHQKSTNQKNLIQNGYQASYHMEKEAERVKNIEDPTHLTAKINENNHLLQKRNETELFIVCDEFKHANSLKNKKELQEIPYNSFFNRFNTNQSALQYIRSAKKQKYCLKVTADQQGRITSFSQIYRLMYNLNNELFRQEIRY